MCLLYLFFYLLIKSNVPNVVNLVPSHYCPSDRFDMEKLSTNGVRTEYIYRFYSWIINEQMEWMCPVSGSMDT